MTARNHTRNYTSLTDAAFYCSGLLAANMKGNVSALFDHVATAQS